MNKIKEEIISMLIEHSRIIYSVVSDMAVFYNKWSEDYEKNKSFLDKKKDKMMLLEEDGDEIKIQLIKNYSEADSQGLGDYVALMLRMDNVVNFPLEFIDLLSNIKTTTNPEIQKRFEKLINKTIKMMGILKATIKSLRDNPDTVFKNTTAIHEIENEIDLIFRQFLEYLYSNEEIDIRTLLRLRDSIKILEELADQIHDIADLIRVLLYQ